MVKLYITPEVVFHSKPRVVINLVLDSRNKSSHEQVKLVRKVILLMYLQLMIIKPNSSHVAQQVYLWISLYYKYIEYIITKLSS
jgi:hypothetical protein